MAVAACYAVAEYAAGSRSANPSVAWAILLRVYYSETTIPRTMKNWCWRTGYFDSMVRGRRNSPRWMDAVIQRLLRAS